MARHYDDFLTAYYRYAKDNFCPNAFHYWTGISIVGGAMGRKCWLSQTRTLKFYPNLYILLVAKPGAGKSSAGNTGVHGLLKEVDKVKFIPSQVTEAKLIDIMSEKTAFEIGGKNQFHSAGYFYASEASNSLRNIYGDFIACITDFYDCPPIWEKATQKDDRITLTNVCFNMLAGCTFSYFGKLMTEEDIMGGFASRLIYIIHDKVMDRSPAWGFDESKDDAEHGKLLADLQDIAAMTGPFKAEPDFKKKYIEWFSENDKLVQQMDNEKLAALFTRKPTNLLKLCMISSASQRADRILTGEHFDRALKWVEETGKGLPKMLHEGAVQKGQNQTQVSLMSAVMLCFREKDEEISAKDIVGRLFKRGFHQNEIRQMLTNLASNGDIAKGEDGNLKLLIDPDQYV